MLSPRICATAALAGLLLPAAAAAQRDANELTATRRLTILRLDAQIRVDGRLDEPVWSRLQPITNFIQTEPDEGAPASERTEVFVFYDNEKIYFGFKCYDSEPAKIVARLDAHDARTFSDIVNIFLDPFGDRRTGYFFSVNARSVQFDALLSEASGHDGTWDGIWESAARIEDWGWTAEVAIPFKSIRFASGQSWGINLGRDIIRKNESSNWQFVTRFDGFMRPSKAGLLEGIAEVAPGRNLEVIPYFSSRIRRGAFNRFENGEDFEGGVDLRWGLLPNATLNATVNPDFADTEADEINISISRFELFFPEKRAFFNEGANFFSTPMDLFFTRRVGERLPNGVPQRILLGAKLTGKLQGWSLGLLEARTQETKFSDPRTGERRLAPAANFFVLRGQRDIWKNSTIGLLTANRDQGPGDVGATQRVHALDLGIVGGPHVKWRSQVAYNQNKTSPNGGIHRIGAQSEFAYESDQWEFGAEYRYVGRGFELSSLGFEPETDRHSADANIQFKPFLGRHGIRQIFFELNQDISLDTAGLTQDSGSDADLRVQFKNFWSARVRYSYDLVRFNEFTPTFGRTPRTRIYIEPRVRFFLNTNESRPLFLSYTFTVQKRAQFRDNFYGREQRHDLTLIARFLGNTRVQFTAAYVREFLLDHTPFQDRRLFITRLARQFTPKLRTRILGQVSNDRLGQNFNVNSIVAYDFTARSALIAGYNYQRRSPSRPGDLGNELFIKLSYLFQF